MNHFQAFGLAHWQSMKLIGLACLSANQDQISTDIQSILQLVQQKGISQYQTITSLPSQFGRWYYIPFNKDVVQLILCTNECNQKNVEMLFDTIDSKIFDHNTTTPSNIDIQQMRNITNLLQYFDKQYNKDPKQIQSILETLNNTKQTVQQNIEKMLNNKDSLSTIEIKSLELEDNSKIFLDSSTALKNKHRLAKLKQRIIIGILLLFSLSVILYMMFG